MIPVRSNAKRVEAYAPMADTSAGLNAGLASSTLFNKYGISATSSRRATLRKVMALTSPGRTDMYDRVDDPRGDEDQEREAERVDVAVNLALRGRRTGNQADGPDRQGKAKHQVGERLDPRTRTSLAKQRLNRHPVLLQVGRTPSRKSRRTSM